MKILKLFVFTDSTQENGIGVKIISQHDATKTEKTYSAKGLRLPVQHFETPLGDRLNASGSRISYDIWTTEENAKESVKKCVIKILEDFKERDAKWNLVKDAACKMESKLTNIVIAQSNELLPNEVKS